MVTIVLGEGDLEISRWRCERRPLDVWNGTYSNWIVGLGEERGDCWKMRLERSVGAGSRKVSPKQFFQIISSCRKPGGGLSRVGGARILSIFTFDKDRSNVGAGWQLRQEPG